MEKDQEFTDDDLLEQVKKTAEGYIMMHEGMSGYISIKPNFPNEFKLVIDQLSFFEPALKKFVQLYLHVEEMFPKKLH